VGVGLPGQWIAASGWPGSAINLPGWREVRFAAWLEPCWNGGGTAGQRTATPPTVGEAWAERRRGGLRCGRNRSCCYTLGTGVGGGLLLGGSLFTGHRWRRLRTGPDRAGSGLGPPCKQRQSGLPGAVLHASAASAAQPA